MHASCALCCALCSSCAAALLLTAVSLVCARICCNCIEWKVYRLCWAAYSSVIACWQPRVIMQHTAVTALLLVDAWLCTHGAESSWLSQHAYTYVQCTYICSLQCEMLVRCTAVLMSAVGLLCIPAVLLACTWWAHVTVLGSTMSGR